MKCYNCNANLTRQDYCEVCGVNVAVYKRILRTADAYYNDGLAKAKVRDLGGAAESLHRSIKYNKYHTDARNLLGLVYFETGDTLHALSEWIISNSLQPEENVAARYLEELRGNAAVLERAAQAIKKYNVAIEYIRTGSEDLAVIQLKRVLALNAHMLPAYQLLALLQMQRGDYRHAKKNLRLAQKIDTYNRTTLAYLKEVDQLYAAHRGNPEHLTSVESNRDRVAYKSGNDLVIQPTSFKESHRFHGGLSVLVGFLAGLLVAWFLILPGQRDKIREEYRAREQELLAKVGDTTLNLATEEPDKADSDVQASGEPQSTKDPSASGEPKSTKDPSASGEPEASKTPGASAEPDETGLDPAVYGDAAARETDDSMTAEDYFDRGADKYDNGEYEEAIANTQKALAIDDTHLMSLYYLGRAYQQLEENEKAITVYERIIELYPDNELADDARRFIGELE